MNSRKRKLAIAAAAATLVATALGLFLWKGGDRRQTGDKDSASSTAAPAGADKAAASDKSPPLPSAAPIAMEDDPIGPLRLEGQVLGPDDEPIGGALVTLSSVPPRTATSEEDGSFVFDKLVGRTYSLTARSGELVSGDVMHTLRDNSEPVVIRLAPGASIEVTVTAAPGERPIAGASVLIEESQLSATTDGEGRATLRGVARGTWTSVAARAEGYAPGQALVVVPDAPGALARAQIPLRTGAPVAGVVVDRRGQPVADARVFERDVSQPFELPNPRDQVTTDKAGRFSLPAVAAGTYRIQVTHPKHAPGSSDPVTVDGVSARSDVRVVLEAGAVLAGQVVDGGGAPVPWATVRVGARTGFTFQDAPTRQVVAREDGKFQLEGLPRAELLALALSDEASSQAVPVDLAAQPEKRDLVLRLDIAGRIAGQVVDGAGEPVAEARVTALPDFFAGGLPEDFGLRGSAVEGTDGGGRFEFRGLPDGAYRLHANRGAAGQSPYARFARKGVAAKVGDGSVRVVLEEDGSLRGRVQLEDGSSPGLFTVSVGMQSGVPVSHPQGEFEVPGVVPGQHDVTVRGPEFAEKVVRDVKVVPAQVADMGVVKVVRGRTVRGRVLTSEGAPVAAATVVLGRQLLGDGTSLATSAAAGFEDQMGVRRATSDRDGSYLIRGIGDKELILAAEHEQHGRSQVTQVPAGTGSPTIELRLAGVGGVAGTVRAGGKPAGSLQVFATPKGAVSHNTLVTTAQDGSYQIQRLAVGEYKVTAMLGAGMGATMASRDVSVVAGSVAQVDIDIQVGDITLRVQVTPEGTGTIDLAQIYLFDGEAKATTGKELQQAVLTASDGTAAKMAVQTGAAPASFPKVSAGSKTACIVPITGDMNDATFMRRIQEHAEKLKVHCRPLTVAPTPAEQSATIAVPPMEPLPAAGGTN